MNNQIIKEVTSQKHLGVYLSNECSWHNNIEYAKGKSWARIYVMRRHKLRLNKNPLRLYYTIRIWDICFRCFYPCEIIRIYCECEGGIEKSVPMITDWHHKACRVMKNGDHEVQIFLSHPHTNNGFFFLLITYYLIYTGKKA